MFLAAFSVAALLVAVACAGPTGETGPPGITGAPGSVGPDGAIGGKGDHGARGFPGFVGPRGSRDSLNPTSPALSPTSAVPRYLFGVPAPRPPGYKYLQQRS